MRIAVTGADGFTGQYLAQALAARGVELVALQAELTTPDAVEAEIVATAFDGLIHLAARAFVGDADWEGFYAVNQIGTLHLLEAVARHRPGINCILASSAQVYGPAAEGLISEDHPTRPNNHYAISKLAMELAAAVWKDRLRITIVRPFNYTGIGQGSEYLVPKIVDHFRRRAPVIELGNQWVKRDFGDVRAVADAYAALALAQAPPPVINIATGIVHSISDIISCLAEISGHDMEVRTNPDFVRPNDVAVLGGNVSILTNFLPKWRQIEFRDTLSWMFQG